MHVQELENAVAVENLELQEQQTDRKELEETLVKLEKHKEKLVQQIKTIRQLCYEESQQVEIHRCFRAPALLHFISFISLNITPDLKFTARKQMSQ